MGKNRTDALVRLYNKIASNQDWLPQKLGVGFPLVKPKGIDDVPIITITLWSKDGEKSASELTQVAHAIEAELKRVPGSRDIYTVGASQRVVHVLLDSTRLAGYGISIQDLRYALQVSSVAKDAESVVNNNNEIQIVAGSLLG